MGILKLLDFDNLQWGRIDAKTIYVYVSGYKTKKCFDVERSAMKSGYMCMTMDFDKYCGQTKLVLKQRG